MGFILIILGIDLGSVNLAYSIIDTSGKENLPKIVKTKYLHLTSPLIGDRLYLVFRTLEKEIEDELVDLIIFEDGVFRGSNGPALNYVAGIFHLLASIYQIPIQAPKPTQIKKLICGNGKADKKDIELEVLKRVSNPPAYFENNHCSDACGVAIYGYLKYDHSKV